MAMAMQAAAVLDAAVVLRRPPSVAEASGTGTVSGRDAVGFAPGASVAGRGRSQGARLEPRRTRAAAKAKEGQSGFGWFKFGSNGMDSEGAGIYGSQKREDFDRDDVEQYFNYMGMLAMDGSYDNLHSLLNTGIQAVDILLLLAASEGDTPKIEELLAAGADCRVKDDRGRTALDRAQDEDIRQLILSKSQVKV